MIRWIDGALRDRESELRELVEFERKALEGRGCGTGNDAVSVPTELEKIHDDVVLLHVRVLSKDMFITIAVWPTDPVALRGNPTCPRIPMNLCQVGDVLVSTTGSKPIINQCYSL